MDMKKVVAIQMVEAIISGYQNHRKIHPDANKQNINTLPIKHGFNHKKHHVRLLDTIDGMLFSSGYYSISKYKTIDSDTIKITINITEMSLAEKEKNLTPE